MRYHAPPPGARTGVADYAEALHREVRSLNIDADVDLYHLGNNPLHASIYDQALRRPGVIVLHDAVLHHFLLGRLSREAYIAEFVYNYGEWRRHLAESLWEERGASGSDARYFEFPMLRRCVESALAVIVHNPAAERTAREHGATRVYVVPHFYAPRTLPDRAEAAMFRQRIGVSQGAVLFGIFGYLRETKRVLSCIAAFRELWKARPDTALLIAGDPESQHVRRLIDSAADHPGVRQLGFLSESEFDTASVAIDCCLNLRYPGAGETSGVAIRMAGAGRLLVVTAGDEYGDWPEASCLRVRPGVAEPGELFDHMVIAAEFPELARTIGGEARRHLLEHHSLRRVAARYRDILCGAGSQLLPSHSR